MLHKMFQELIYIFDKIIFFFLIILGVLTRKGLKLKI